MGWQDDAPAVDAPVVSGGELLREPILNIPEWRNDPVDAQPYRIEIGGVDHTSPVASLMNAGQGVSFGFGDEIAGSLGADKDRYRATLQQFQREFPKSALLGNISGGLLVPFGVAKSSPAAVTNPYMTSAAAGLAAGGLQGAGDSEDMSTLPQDAAFMGAVGMVGGPALKAGGDLLGSVAGPLTSQVTTRLPKFGKGRATKAAHKIVGAAFERDGVPAKQIAGTLQELGPEARIVDAGDTNVFQVLDTNAVMPGQTGKATEAAIRSRQAGRPERLDAIVDMAHGGNGRAGDVFDSWQAQKQNLAGPLYKKLYSMNVVPSRELEGHLKAAREVGAWSEAEKIAAAKELPFTLNGKPVTVNSVTNQVQGNYSMRDIDHVKQGLDQLISKETKPDGVLTPKGQAYDQLRRKLLGEADKLTNGEYKVARDAFSGPAALQDALQAGRRFVSMDAESIGKTMRGMSNSEREAFRIGAAEGLRQKFGSQGGQTEYMNAWKNRNVREKLKTIFRDEGEYNKAIKMLENEAKMARMERAGRGSQTAGRQFSAEDQTMMVADVAGKAATGGWVGAAMNYLRQVGVPESVRNEVGNILLRQGGLTGMEIKAIEAAQKAHRANVAGSAALSGYAGSQAGTAYQKAKNGK